MPYYDLNKIKEIPIRDIAENCYNFELKEKGDKIFCNIRKEKTASCCLYIEQNTFYDYGNNIGGSVIDFVKAVDNVDFNTAVDFLAKQYNIQPENMKANSKPLRFISKEVYNYLGINADNVFSNINTEDFKEFSVQKYWQVKKKYNNMSMRELQVKDKVLHDKLIKLRNIEDLKSIKSTYKIYENILTSEDFYSKDYFRLLGAKFEVQKLGYQINKTAKLLAYALEDKKYENYMVDFEKVLENIDEKLIIKDHIDIVKEVYQNEKFINLLSNKEILNIYELNKFSNKNNLERPTYPNSTIDFLKVDKIKELYKASGGCLESISHMKQKPQDKLTPIEKQRLGMENLVIKMFELTDKAVKSINEALSRGQPETQKNIELTNELEIEEVYQ